MSSRNSSIGRESWSAALAGEGSSRRRECGGVGPLQSGVLNIAQREQRSLVVCWVIKEKKKKGTRGSRFNVLLTVTDVEAKEKPQSSFCYGSRTCRRV